LQDHQEEQVIVQEQEQEQVPIHDQAQEQTNGQAQDGDSASSDEPQAPKLDHQDDDDDDGSEIPSEDVVVQVPSTSMPLVSTQVQVDNVLNG
jgi:hypothetical protein